MVKLVGVGGNQVPTNNMLGSMAFQNKEGVYADLLGLAAGSAAAPSLIPSGDANTGMWFPAADTIAFSAGGTEQLRIASTGTATVAGTLTAGSSVAASGSAVSMNVFFSSSNTFSNGFNAYKRGTTGDANAAVVNGSEIGYHSFFGWNGSAYNRGAYVIVSAAENQTATNGGMHYRIHTAALGSTSALERLRVTSEGRVGIGTTAPDALLSVNGIASFGAGAAATPSVTAFGDLDTGMWFPAANTLAWSTGGTERLRLTSGGNLGLGTSTFGTSAATVLAIANGTAPSTGPADTIQLYSSDLSAGNTMLSLWTEGTIVNANTTAAATHRIAIRVNGTVYYLLANTAA